MKKLVAYITSGLPSSDFTVELALKLKENGVDSLELGIPFSDPVADGPTIEEANLKALKKGFKTDNLFFISSQIAKEIDTLWMGYFNSFYHKGFEYFLQRASSYGVSGFIIPDLPCEECNPYLELYRKYGVHPIGFVAPTDSKERIIKITKEAKKFIYLVAYTGITGSGREENLDSVIADIKSTTNTPVYLGFGVNQENVKEKARAVDGVIVGSAIVKVLLDESITNTKKIERICNMTKEMKEKMNG